MNISTVFLSTLIIASSVANAAEKKTSQAPKANTPVKTKKKAVTDFKKGFALFHKLGVPDVSKCEYVKVSTGHHNRRTPMQGNAWLIKTEKDKGFWAWENNIKIFFHDEKLMHKQRQKEYAKIMKECKNDIDKLTAANYKIFKKYRNIRSGNYSKVNIRKDIKSVLKFIDNLSRDSYHSNEAVGKFMIFAVNIYDKGFKKEANEIAAKLFSAVGKKQAIMATINTLGSSLYKEVFNHFQASLDWKKYEADIEALLKKMPSAWNKKPLMKILLKNVKIRLSGKAPEIKGENLTPEQLAIAKELANIKEFDSNRSLWLLPPIKKPKVDTSKSKDKKTKVKKSKTPLEKIIEGRVQSIPLLVALLKDNYMTEAFDFDLYGNNFGYIFDNDDLSKSEKYTKAYMTMDQRPCTRGDIAFKLLSVIVPGFNSYNRDTDLDNLAEKAMELYETLKDKSPKQIAVYYLENSTGYMTSAAVTYLVDANDLKLLEKVESYYINNASLQNSYQVMEYLDKRGSKAKDFVKKYMAALKAGKKAELKQMMQYSDSNTNAQKMKKDLEDRYKETEKSFQKFISLETLEQYLVKQLKKKEFDNDFYGTIRFKTRRMSTNEIVKDLLKIAVEAKDSRSKNKLLELLSDITSKYFPREIPSETFSDYKETKVLWEKLFKDNSEFDNNKVSKTAYFLFARLVFSGEKADVLSSIKSLPDSRVIAIIKKCAAAKFADKDLPKFPSASNITDKQYKETADALLKTKDLESKIKTLSDSMYLKILSELDVNKKLNAKLLPLANRIVNVDIKIKDKEVLKKLPSFKGEFTPELLKKVFEVLKDARIAKFNIICQISSKPGLQGISIDIYQEPVVVYHLNRIQNNRLATSLRGRGLNSCFCDWTIEDTNAPKAKKAAEKKTEEDDLFAEAVSELDEEVAEEQDERQKNFWLQSKEFFQKSNAMVSGIINIRQILTR